MTYTVYFSLGSNLGNREENLEKAVRLLQERAGKLISRSAFCYSEPWGFESDNGFVNICLAIETELRPFRLLDITQEIEREIGRSKKSIDGNYADRLIDIDLLLIGSPEEQIIDQERLKIPHPLMHQRAFVLTPLCEIAPEMVHPVLQKKIVELTKLLTN